MDQAGVESFIRDEQTHFWFIGRRAIFLDVLRHDVGNLGDDAVVLDIGCGVGGMLPGLRDIGSPYGTEVDHRMVAHCRRRGFDRVFQARAKELPVADASVDLLTAFDVIEHIAEEEETLAECLRVLKPGGRLFMSGPSYQWLYTHQDKMVEHQRRYSIRGLRRKLTCAGFEVVRGSYIQFFLFPMILVLTLLRRLHEHFRPPTENVPLNSEIPMPAALNRLFTLVFSSERYFLRWLDFPFGHSLIALARKPVEPAQGDGPRD